MADSHPAGKRKALPGLVFPVYLASPTKSRGVNGVFASQKLPLYFEVEAADDSG